MGQTAYDSILLMLDQKYQDVYSSLFSFNDDILDENLLHYLYEDNYVVLMKIGEDVHVMQGLNSDLYGYDPYGEVEQGQARHMFTGGKYNKAYDFNKNNAVVVYSNKAHISMRSRIYELLTELASVHYMIQNNARLSNVKAIINATTTSASTMENVLSEMLLMPRSYIVAKSKDKLQTELSKIDLEVEYIADKYIATIMFYHQQILEVFGINFTPHEKKERLVTNEVDSNNNLLDNIQNQTRKHFERKLKQANSIFGTSFSLDIQEEEQEPEDSEDTKDSEMKGDTEEE